MYIDRTDTPRPSSEFMQESHASATIHHVFVVTGRGWMLERVDLEGIVRTGDWIFVGTTSKACKAVQVIAVEFVDHRLAHQAAVAVVIRKLKSLMLDNLRGQRVQFVHDEHLRQHGRDD
ncbi:hypothetical protein MF271_23245 (plasmid) [Deinococcus sp. KNUC1210]|uniref:hypothetical protein n=1 Tax=Deinococcus sp. KNUC1210 TaxID=2917691 RepID=UPI001EEFBF3D|nr:hypothetical protein [Deinococcus sp. KNUC1210]ULH17893.1 hypothetical protein MF271_23245 [Deinococcus sp. KNUC1210]